MKDASDLRNVERDRSVDELLGKLLRGSASPPGARCDTFRGCDTGACSLAPGGRRKETFSPAEKKAVRGLLSDLSHNLKGKDKDTFERLQSFFRQ